MWKKELEQDVLNKINAALLHNFGDDDESTKILETLRCMRQCILQFDLEPKLIGRIDGCMANLLDKYPDIIPVLEFHNVNNTLSEWDAKYSHRTSTSKMIDGLKQQVDICEKVVSSKAGSKESSANITQIN